MKRFYEKPGNVLGMIALGVFVLWIMTIPFLPRPGRPRGEETPSGFVGQLWRFSAYSQDFVDPVAIEINDSLTEVTVRSTGQNFSVRDLIDRTEHSEISVLCRTEGFIVCQYGPYVFVVDDRDLIIHIATSESYQTDGLYPCPPQETNPPDSEGPTVPKARIGEATRDGDDGDD